MVASNNAIYNTVGASISGVTNTLTITNPSNTASSAARETITVGGGSAGDPTINWNVSGVTNWEMGIDNSVSDNLTISQGTALGTNDVWRMDTSGRRTMPLQPAFLYVLQTTDANVTGDNTGYIFGSGNALTKIYDQANNTTTAGVFTAPVTGVYLLEAQLFVTGITAAMTYGIINIFAGANVFLGDQKNMANASPIAAVPNTTNLKANGMLLMTAGQTAFVTCAVAGGTKTADILGNANFNSFFYGALLC